MNNNLTISGQAKTVKGCLFVLDTLVSSTLALILSRGGNMEQFYRVVKHDNNFVVRAKGIRKDIVSFPYTNNGYLRAKIRAHRGNIILSHPEMECVR